MATKIVIVTIQLGVNLEKMLDEGVTVGEMFAAFGT